MGPRFRGDDLSSASLPNREELHFEKERRVRRNDAAGAARAVAQVGRNGELALAADFHAGDALFPAADHFAAPEREHERLAAILARVEFAARLSSRIEPAGVMHADSLPVGGGRAVADNQVLDQKTARRLDGIHGTLSVRT